MQPIRLKVIQKTIYESGGGMVKLTPATNKTVLNVVPGVKISDLDLCITDDEEFNKLELGKVYIFVLHVENPLNLPERL